MTALALAPDTRIGCEPAAAAGVDRAIRVSTAIAVLAVAGVAAYVSYWHAYAVICAHGETGVTARLEPATIDGLVYASSMVSLYAARHRLPVPALARSLLALGIIATLAANMAQGWSHGPVGAVIAAWPAVSLVGGYELSLGVSSLLHDVALKRFTESFCNTSAMCGARCRRCSEACPPRTCNVCNTLDRHRRRTYPAATCTSRRVTENARFCTRENELLVWIIRTAAAGDLGRGPAADHGGPQAGRYGTSLGLAAAQGPDGAPGNLAGPDTGFTPGGADGPLRVRGLAARAWQADRAGTRRTMRTMRTRRRTSPPAHGDR
jgi:hypothetical protein